MKPLLPMKRRAFLLAGAALLASCAQTPQADSRPHQTATDVGVLPVEACMRGSKTYTFISNNRTSK